MSATKARSSSKKQLKATLRKLRSRLERAETKAARWKKRAKRSEEEAATLKARTATLDKKLEKARQAKSRPTPPRAGEPPSPTALDAPEDQASTEQATATPDAGWTVVQLRAEARSRGLTGLSGASKADLISALT